MEAFAEKFQFSSPGQATGSALVNACRINQHLRKIVSMASPYVPNDLDDELPPLPDTKDLVPNQINIPPSEGAPTQQITVKEVAQELAERRVWAVTGTTG
jgi:hypothetical protein